LKLPATFTRWPWPHIVIHPDDAAPHGIESGDLIEGFNDTVYVQTGAPTGVKDDDLSFTALLENGHIRTVTGQFVAVALVSDEIRAGVAKAAFNYPGSLANAVCHAVPDPVTGNYRYKLGRGVLRRIGESAYKHNFLEMSLKPRPLINTRPGWAAGD
jgi:arsenite oxidase large subunit